MDLALILNSWVFLCALIGFIYGCKQFFKPKKPIVMQIITCAVACLMYARLFHVIFFLVHEGVDLALDISVFGLAGSMLFILSANYGQMDSLVDDGSKQFLPTRIIALLAPVIVIASYVFLFIQVDVTMLRIEMGIVIVFMIPCVYYSLKHIIIFDVSSGIIRSMRPYNILALLYAMTELVEFFGEYLNIEPLYIGSMVVQGIVALAIIPAAKKGVTTWTI